MSDKNRPERLHHIAENGTKPEMQEALIAASKEIKRLRTKAKDFYCVRDHRVAELQGRLKAISIEFYQVEAQRDRLIEMF